MGYKDYSNEKEQFKDTIAYCKTLKVGDKIKFATDVRKYTIKAKSDRYLICTKPFNLKQTCLYTIIDLERLVRGTNDYVFSPYDYMIQEEIDECLRDLEAGDVEVTHRNCVKLDVEVA